MDIMFKKIICPFCFKEFKRKEIKYMCPNQQCPVTQNLRGHIITNPKVGSNGLCSCDVCLRPTGIKVCPYCFSELPHHIEKTITISIIGCCASGKTYFLGTLLKKLIQDTYLSNYGTSSICGDKKTSDAYESIFKRYFESNRLLPPTRIDESEPKFIELAYNKNKRIEKSLLSIWDAPGEGIYSVQSIGRFEYYHKSVKSSDCIILIVDPLTISYVKSKIEKSSCTSFGNYDPFCMIQNLLCVLNNNGNEKHRKHKIPLCIAFSKWDIVTETPGLLPDGLMCGQSSIQMGSGYDEQRIDTISNEIRSLLMQQWNEAGLVDLAELNFETVKYFSFSAWGSSNSGKSGAPDITSYRVEDPLLWVLHRNGII